MELLYRLLLAAALLCALSFVASTYFRVKTIEVRGNAVCSADAIAEASGVQIGDRLLFVDRKAVADGIFARLPYADTVRVRRSFPSTLIIEMRESTPAAAVITNGVVYLIDGDGKLLEYMPSEAVSGTPLVEGLTVTEAVLGKTINLEDELHLSTLQELLKAFADEDILTHIDTVQVEKLYDIYFVYDECLTVKIGDVSDLGRKLELMEEVVKKLNSGEKGTLDVTEVGTARYMAENIS